MLYSLPIISDQMAQSIAYQSISPDADLLSSLRLGSGGRDPFTAYLEQNGADVILRSGNDFIQFGNREVRVIFNEIAELSDRLEMWQKELDACIDTNGTLKDIVDCCRPVLGNPIFIVDRREIVFAMSDDPAGTVDPEWDYMLDNGRLPYRQVSAIYRDETFASVMRSPDTIGKPYLFKPPGMEHRSIIFRIPDPSSDSAIGNFVIIETSRRLSPGLMHLARIASLALSRWAKLHRQDHNMKGISELMADLIGEQPLDPDEIELQMSMHHLQGKTFYLAVIPAPKELEVPFLGPVLEKEIYNSLSFEYENDLLLLCPTETDIGTIRESLFTIAVGLPIRIGISYPFTDLLAMRSAYRQAKIALEHGDHSVSGLDPGSAMRYLVTELSELLHGSEIMHPALKVLIEHDRLHDSQYYDTLFSYLQHERNLVKTAAALFIHRNSLVYRIARINELIQVDLDDYDVRLYLMLSYLCRDCKDPS